MNCVEWEERIAGYAGADISAAESAEVEAHLGKCSGCAELATLLLSDRQRLRSMPTQVDDAEFAAMRRQLMRRIERPARIMQWAAIGAVAAGLLLAVALPRRHSMPVVARPVASTTAQNHVSNAQDTKPTIAKKITPRRVYSAAAPQMEMRLTTDDPDVTIILLPVTTENPHE